MCGETNGKRCRTGMVKEAQGIKAGSICRQSPGAVLCPTSYQSTPVHTSHYSHHEVRSCRRLHLHRPLRCPGSPRARGRQPPAPHLLVPHHPASPVLQPLGHGPLLHHQLRRDADRGRGARIRAGRRRGDDPPRADPDHDPALPAVQPDRVRPLLHNVRGRARQRGREPRVRRGGHHGLRVRDPALRDGAAVPDVQGVGDGPLLHDERGGEGQRGEQPRVQLRGHRGVRQPPGLRLFNSPVLGKHCGEGTLAGHFR